MPSYEPFWTCVPGRLNVPRWTVQVSNNTGAWLEIEAGAWDVLCHTIRAASSTESCETCCGTAMLSEHVTKKHSHSQSPDLTILQSLPAWVGNCMKYPSVVAGVFVETCSGGRCMPCRPHRSAMMSRLRPRKRRGTWVALRAMFGMFFSRDRQISSPCTTWWFLACPGPDALVTQPFLHPD